MTDEQPIYDEEKMQQKVVYPTKQTPSYADWALYNMGAALEEKVDGMGSGLPEHTSEDAGKVLKVTAQNEVAWATDEQGHAQVQANWNETDNTQPSYIQNKPTIPSDFEYIKDVSGGPYTITANGNTTITAETLANEYYRKDIIVFVRYVSDKVMVRPRQEMDTNQIKFDVVNSSLDTTCYIDYTVYAKDIIPGREEPEGVNICSVIGAVGRKYAAVPNSTTTDADKVLTVGANGVPAWQTPSGGVPAIASGDAGKVLTVNAGETGTEWVTPSGGLPAIASGDAGKVLAVNSDETGTEWITPLVSDGYEFYKFKETNRISISATTQAEVHFNCSEFDNGYEYLFLIQSSSVNLLICSNSSPNDPVSKPDTGIINRYIYNAASYGNGAAYICAIVFRKPWTGVTNTWHARFNSFGDLTYFVGSGGNNRLTSGKYIFANVGNTYNGKILKVSNGQVIADDLPTELPAYTSADAGKVLSVNASGQLEWITPGS